jgi:hypothetical protein
MNSICLKPPNPVFVSSNCCLQTLLFFCKIYKDEKTITKTPVERGRLLPRHFGLQPHHPATFDGSITNDPNGVAMVAAISNAIQVFQFKIMDNVTVKIHFTNDLSVGLGQSLSVGNNYSYSDFLTALQNHAASVNDTNSLSKIPNTTTDPVVGGTEIYINKAPARLLGLTSSYGSDGFDSTIMLNMSFMNFSRPPLDPNKYDLSQVTQHEIDEVMGSSSDLPESTISPVDLFRYTTNLSRAYTTNGNDAYFSVDGTNLLARFNMHAGGDYSDWYSFGDTWAPPGQTPVSQVQDAYSLPGNALDLGVNELTMLDVLGWTLTGTATQTPPLIQLVRSGVNQFTLSWTNTATGYTLQERTNLLTGAWAASTTGSTNPAVIVSTDSQKFYRLYQAAVPALQQSKVVLSNHAKSPDQLRIRSLQPRQP